MTQQDIESLKDQVVASLAALAPAGWKCLFLDFEIQDVGREYVSSPVAIAVVKRLMRTPEKVDLPISTDPSGSKAVKDLAISLMRSKETDVVTIDVVVPANGEPRWQFDFSPPPRVTALRSGDLTAEFHNPSMRMPYIKFASQDEWLAKIV